MVTIAYITILSIIFTGLFTNFFNYSYILYSMASVVMFFMMYIVNYCGKKQNIITFIASLFLYALYDVSFSFVLGNNVIAWCVADIIIFNFKNDYCFYIKTRHYMIMSLVFFVTLNLICFVVRNVFIFEIFIYQILFSFLGTLILTFFEGRRVKI